MAFIKLIVTFGYSSFDTVLTKDCSKAQAKPGILKMSNESAKKFLADAAHNMVLREKFTKVTNPQEFINTVEELGYSFTTEELKDVVKEYSEGVVIRRKTGVWQWLRSINWV